MKTEKDGTWGKPAVVVGTAKTPRSYDIQTESGILRRNRKHLQRIPRDERGKREEDKDEVPGNTHKPTEECRRNPDDENVFDTTEESSCNAETPIETIPTPPVHNRITAKRSEGIQTRSGRRSVPPDRLNL